MHIKQFQKELERLHKDIAKIVEKNIPFIKTNERTFHDFRKVQANHLVTNVENTLRQLQETFPQVVFGNQFEKDRASIKKQLKSLEYQHTAKNAEKMFEICAQMLEQIKYLPPEPEQNAQKMTIKGLNIPNDVASDILTDIQEIEKCFNAQCYRCVTILCGRVLEAALHRKYFDVTGQDILEKNPGIGLGNLVAKLNEKNIKFDPGLTQQIHLINQVRVFSVHKKQEPFLPSKEQAQAMILYTVDILKKMF